jgi:hypothetical protein
MKKPSFAKASEGGGGPGWQRIQRQPEKEVRRRMTLRKVTGFLTESH